MANTEAGRARQQLGFLLVPGVYLRVLAETVRALGHDDASLYEGLGFMPDDLRANDSRVFVTDAMCMANRAVKLAGADGLSLALARELRLTIHGTLGLAALTSPTLAGALDSVRRYLQLRAPFLSLTQSKGDDCLLMQLRLEFDVPQLQHFLIETVSVTLMLLAEQLIDRDSAGQNGFDLSGGKLPGVRVQFSCAPPAYYPCFAELLPVTLEYGQPGDIIIIPEGLLASRMQLGDAAASRMAREQCESDLQQALKEQGDLAFAVRNMLNIMPAPLPALDRMAERFFVSPRTFKRRLAESDTAYREIVESVLKDRAIQLLRYTAQSISEIGYELGYADVSSFSHAFRKWTGKSASEFRADGPDPAPELGP